MTLSVEVRKAAMTRVLVRLAEMFKDAPRGNFGDGDLAGTSPLRTTLDELEDQGWIRLTMFLSDTKPYELTVNGWSHAQRIAGHFETDEFVERRGKLCAALKDVVKDRADQQYREPGEIARAANLPRVGS